MNNKILYVLGILFGSIITLFGSLGVFFGIIAILDPVGTQLSDDSNPLGTPPTTIESLTITAIYFLILSLGITLIYGTYKWKMSYSEKTKLK